MDSIQELVGTRDIDWVNLGNDVMMITSEMPHGRAPNFAQRSEPVDPELLAAAKKKLEALGTRITGPDGRPMSVEDMFTPRSHVIYGDVVFVKLRTPDPDEIDFSEYRWPFGEQLQEDYDEYHEVPAPLEFFSLTDDDINALTGHLQKWSIRRNPYEFRGPSLSPLAYHRASNIKRLALCDTDITDPPKPDDAYFARTERWRRYSKRGGRRLKKPVLEEIIPGVDDNCIAVFLDYHEYGDDGYYIDYVKTRRDLQGKGYASAIIDYFYEMHSKAKLIHWGKLMRKEMGHLLQKMKKKYPNIESIGSVNYR
jgi:hypothetical protein